MTALLLVLIGVFAGFLSGLVGIGGGVVMVPLFVFVLGLEQHQAQGLSLSIMLLPITYLAVYQYHKKNKIDYKKSLWVAVFFILGGYVGALISNHVPPFFMKKIFALFLGVFGVKMLMDKK